MEMTNGILPRGCRMGISLCHMRGIVGLKTASVATGQSMSTDLVQVGHCVYACRETLLHPTGLTERSSRPLGAGISNSR